MGGNGTTTIYDNGTAQGDRNPANQPLTSPSGTPFSRLNPMLRFEFNFKISDSFTWWFHSGLDIGIVRLVQDLDPVLGGGGAGGTALYLEVSAGPRVYFLTDEVRPFLEIGARIPIPGLIPFSKSNDFIPQNVKTFPGVYATFGVEFFVARDIALSIGATYTRFILFNFPGFNSLDGRFGVLFYM